MPLAHRSGRVTQRALQLPRAALSGLVSACRRLQDGSSRAGHCPVFAALKQSAVHFCARFLLPIQIT
jgi:hypothetical protein